MAIDEGVNNNESQNSLLFTQRMSKNIVTWYWAIYCLVFIYWLMLFCQDESTPNNDLVSWSFLIIAPLLWPIVLPISSWELSQKALNNILI